MAPPARLTAAEYFEIDDASEVRYELIDGVLYAMAGGTFARAKLSARLSELIGPQKGIGVGMDTKG